MLTSLDEFNINKLNFNKQIKNAWKFFISDPFQTWCALFAMEEQRLYSPRVTRYYKNKRGKKPCYVLILKKKKIISLWEPLMTGLESLDRTSRKKKESNEKRVSSNLFVSTTHVPIFLHHLLLEILRSTFVRALWEPLAADRILRSPLTSA